MVERAMATPLILTRTQLKDDAAVFIRELIVSGQVRQGSLLRLSPLAEQLGASVTPIREALLLLAQDGWVKQEPNVGFRVAPIRRQDVEDAYLVQAYVSGELAARAATRIGEETLRSLRRLDREMAGKDMDPADAIEIKNYELHNLIFATANSPRLWWFAQAAARFVPRRFWGLIEGWPEHNRRGHKPIIDALAKRDADAARAAMSKHIAAAGKLLLGHLDAVGFWNEGAGDSA